MSRSKAVETLIRRRDFLEQCIEADTANTWDRREVAALNRAIDALDDLESEVSDDGAVTYKGGKQWAVKRNDVGAPCAYMPMKTRRAAELRYQDWLARAQEKYPDEPELWPEIVSARVVWRVES